MIVAYCDGACEPRNPGGWGVGGWVIRYDGEILHRGAADLGQYPEMTNNIAEYGAVRGALQQLLEMDFKPMPVVVRTDSQLIVRQLERKWGASTAHLITLRDECLALAKKLEARGCQVTYEWIPREQNKEADGMSRSLYHGRMAPGMPEPDYDAPKRKRKR